MSVIENYLNLLGPLRQLVARAAAHLSTSLAMLGLPAPSEAAVAVAVATIVGILTLSLLLSLAGSVDLSGLFPLGRLLSRGDRRRRDAVVIVGVSGGDGSGGSSDEPAVGKTTLFKTLTGSGRQPTHGTTTSMKTNVAPLQLRHANAYLDQQQKELSLSSTTVDGDNYDATRSTPSSGSSESNIKNTPVMDCPGHPRLRHKLPTALRSAKAILFVIDAHRFATRARHDALLLYDILTHPFVAGSGSSSTSESTPVAIVVNKRDLMPAQRLPLSAVRARLEAELDRVRKASDADMSLRSHTAVGGAYNNYGDDDGDGDGAAERRRRRGTMYGGDAGGEVDGVGTDDQEWERVPIGYENEAFAFDQIPGRIELVDASAILGDVGQVTTFLEECLA